MDNRGSLTPKSQTRNGQKCSARPNYLIAIIVSAVIVAIAAGGYFFYDGQKTAERESVEAELNTIAELKVSQIAQWRTERTGNAEAAMDSPFFIQGVSGLVKAPNNQGLKDEVSQELAGMGKSYPYQDILLVNPGGSVMISVKHNREVLPDSINAQLLTALSAGSVTWVDFYLSSENSAPELGLIAPLFLSERENAPAMAAVIFIIDPATYLYEAIQQWPTSSQSAETLLVERQGDQVIYLNNLRNQNKAALQLKIPLSQQKVPAVMAVYGIEGTFSGIDYRGVEVLSALKRIPGSPWYIVAKIDRSEIYTRWNIQMALIIVLTVVLAAVFLSVLGYIWQNRQRRVYQALYKENSEHKTLLNQFEYMVKYANEINLICDDKNRIVQVNDRVLEAYGYSQDEITGLNFATLIAEKDLPAFQSQLNSIQEKGAITTEGTHKRKDGSTFPVAISARLFKIEEAAYLQAIILDISEQKIKDEEISKMQASLEKRVEERTAELENANKELESFAYSVSHDLRAPLRGIDGWSQALVEDYKDKLGDKGVNILSRIRSETQRMGQLIDDLLRFSRETRGELKMEEVVLTGIVQSVTSRLQLANPERQIKFLIQQDLKARCDSHLMEMALSNLLENAVKFTSKTEQALILFGEIHQQGKKVFFVRDNGAGFDMAYADKLFKVFQRLHKPSEYPGTGIGLATVQRIINRHGGRIWVEAQVNQGATFYFTLKETG
jgi:PAS domain S-box-containing protein